VLSQVNQAVVRANSRDELLETICRIMVERGAINLAWIGWLDPETATIVPVAHWGKHEELLNQAVFYADDRPEGHGNPGRAIRKDKPVLCNECISGTCLYPAEFAPSQFGFNSCGSFPIHLKGRVCGVLNLGVEKAGFFQEREIKLLEEVAQDISFALDKLEGDARRAQAEEALRKSEEQYRLLVETSNEGVWAMDSRHVTTYVNQAMAEMLGYEPSEMIGTAVEEYFYPEDQSFHQDRMKQRHAGEDEVYERRFRRRDGSSLWTMVSAKALKDDEGRFMGSFAMFTDITERKRAEDLLRESEARFRGYFELGQVGMAITSLEKGWVQFNDRLCEILGYPRQELSKLTWAELTYPDDLAADIAQFDRVLRGEIDAYRMEKRFIRKNGEIIHALISAQCVRRADGRQVDHFVAMVDDITERKQAEERLMKSERRFRSILDQAADIIMVHDLHGRLLDVNQQACRILGYSKEELLTMNVSEIDPEAIASGKAQLWDVIAEGERFTFESRQKRKDGSMLPVEVTIGPIEVGEETLVLDIVRDITERKRAAEEKQKMESQLRHTQKLEAVGTLAGGIAHDFNNILSSIIGYTEMVMDSIEESSSSRYDLDQVLTAANRAKDLVRQILSFSRLGEDQLMRPIDMSLIVEEALKLLRASLPRTIEIRQNIHKVTVVADATQIHQVVVNLCTNAAHAMEEMGILDVSLQEVRLKAQDLAELSIADLSPGKYLKLSVKDTGMGMSSDTMQRIFDPYFTTKEVGKGTGLGLAVVHGIVKRHGGEILVKSEVGRGTAFDVFIPVVESNLKREAVGSQVLPKGSERILLVDDEPPIVAIGARILEPLGYRVTAMTSPKEALGLFQSQPDKFDLIITDYTMPQMVGTQLVSECRRIRAEIPVIICTGHSERLNKELTDRIGANAVAMKPLDRKQLAMLVREVLDKAAG
jgi:PAS domain S-box-containing protein